MTKKLKFIFDPVFLLVLVVGAGACLFRLAMADLDIDESFTALVCGGGFGQILNSVKAASTPPFYFYLLWGWQELFGSAAVTLRLLSVLIGLASLTAIYFFMRSILSQSAARWSAFLMAISPLWLFRARDVRMYSLVALLALLAMAALCRALSRNRPPDWIILALVLTTGCYTHNVLVFLVPVALLPIGMPRLRERRPALILSVALAIALWLPWLPVIRQQADTVALQWLAPFWDALPPALALPKSLLVFVPGTAYPIVMRPMPDQAGLMILIPILIVGGALFYVIRSLTDIRQPMTTNLSPAEIRWLMIAFLLGPLFLMWGYSISVRPIYLVGRYDIVALPAFCMLAGWGLSRWVKSESSTWLRLRSIVVIVLLGVAWIATLVPYYQGLNSPRFIRSSLSAAFLADKMQSGDALVYLGLRRSRLEYALRRRGFTPSRQASFPAELDRHPAWISPEDMMSRVEDLRQEGLNFSKALHQYAGAERRVWIATAGDKTINRLLMEPLSQRFKIDGAMSSFELGIYGLKPNPDQPETQ